MPLIPKEEGWCLASGAWGLNGQQETGTHPSGPWASAYVQEGCALTHLSLSANNLDNEAITELSR